MPINLKKALTATASMAMLYAVLVLITAVNAHADGLPKGGKVAESSPLIPVLDLAKAASGSSWTGFYVGGNVGYGWVDGDHVQTNGGMKHGPFNVDGDGFTGGIVLGANYQIKQLVLGVEVEGGYMDISGDGRIPSSDPKHHQEIDTDGGFYGLIAGRVGFAWDRTLIYGKGGYAWLDGNAGQTTTKPGYETHRSGNFQGYVYGAGIETAVTERMSVRFEWLRFDLDTVGGSQESITDYPVGFNYTNKTDVQIDTLKLGVNFKF